MKTKITAIPKLLVDPVKPATWQLNVKTKYEWITMTFSAGATAKKTYDQIKSQGTFSGQWITEIELKEVTVNE